MKSKVGFITAFFAAFAVLVAVPIGLSCFFGYDVYDNDKIIARDNDYHESEKLSVHMTEDKDNEWSFNTEKFWGVFAMKYFTAEENAVYTFDCNLNESKGDFKLVLVDLDSNEIVTPIYDEDNNVTSAAAELAPASYAIKAVGRRAGVTGEFHINTMENV